LAFEELLAITNVKLTYAHEKKGALQWQLEMCKFFAKEKQKKCFIGWDNIYKYRDGLFKDERGYTNANREILSL
jgi:hypothetical protein